MHTGKYSCIIELSCTLLVSFVFSENAPLQSSHVNPKQNLRKRFLERTRRYGNGIYRKLKD